MHKRYIVYIRVIATVGSCLAFLFIGWPLADEYLHHRQVVRDIEELRDEHQRLFDQRNSMEARHEQLSEKLATYEQRSITAESMNTFRDKIVEMVRDHGCRIRQARVTDPQTRPWKGPEDDPLVSASDSGFAGEGFDLVTTQLHLTVTGDFSAIQTLCKEIVEANYLAVTEFISLQPVDVTGQAIQMELRIKFFGIKEREAAEDEFEGLPLDVANSGAPSDLNV
ncbi:hypothetical protein SH139x_003497 [Planctomycetaceae bacterium SH139]